MLNKKYHFIIGCFGMTFLLFFGCQREKLPNHPVPDSPDATLTVTITPTIPTTDTATVTPTWTITPTPSLTATASYSATPTVSVLTATPSITPTCTATPTITSTPTVSVTPTASFTATPSASPTETATPTATSTNEITGPATLSCSPSTVLAGEMELDLHGNLNSAQRADQSGGILQLGTTAQPVLPFVLKPVFNGAKAVTVSWNSGLAMSQLGDFTQPLDTNPTALPHHPQAFMLGGVAIPSVVSFGVSTYAWNQPASTLPPACSCVKIVTDMVGAFHEITFLFYQVNDLGTASPPVNAGAPITQVAYAWYAFETTGGQQPGNTNIIGGTGVYCGDDVGNSHQSYNWCQAGSNAWGDFLYFNSNGTLASEGGLHGVSGVGIQSKPYLYLTVSGGSWSFLAVKLNFGTAGMSGYGLRDGITGDAAPSYMN
jgi:hypothetical protein